MSGLKVYNDDNSSIGSINDLLTDRTGNIKAVVIGVGGVLGVGEQLVAVPFDKIKFVNEPVPSSTASSTTTTPSAAGDRPMSSTTTGTATTNTVPTGAAPAMTANANPWYPDHAVFNARGPFAGHGDQGVLNAVLFAEGHTDRITLLDNAFCTIPKNHPIHRHSHPKLHQNSMEAL